MLLRIFWIAYILIFMATGNARYYCVLDIQTGRKVCLGPSLSKAADSWRLGTCHGMGEDERVAKSVAWRVRLFMLGGRA